MGANERGAEILRASKDATIPIVSRVSRFDTLDDHTRRVFDMECRAADLYALALLKPLPSNSEFTNKIIIVD